MFIWVNQGCSDGGFFPRFNALLDRKNTLVYGALGQKHITQCFMDEF